MDLSRNIVVGFSSTDFYYVTAATSDTTITSTLANCSQLPSCGDPANIDASKINDCYQREVCINKDTAQWIQNYQNKHSGSDQNHVDTKSIYNSTLQGTANLGIGIFATIVYIYFNM
jgi:hypothetical protein